MSRNVYPWPASIIAGLTYRPAERTRTTTQWGDAPGQTVVQSQRAVIEVSGAVDRASAMDLEVALDRLYGGINLVGLWDMEMRLANGWDGHLAGQGASEQHNAQGLHAIFTGAAPAGQWRSVIVSGSGSAGATSLSVSGLLTGETFKKGTLIRAGDDRYRLAADASESGGGATLTLARPLISAVSGDLRLPGDYVVARLVGDPELGASDHNGLRDYALTLIEVYETEVDGGFTYQS